MKRSSDNKAHETKGSDGERPNMVIDCIGVVNAGDTPGIHVSQVRHGWDTVGVK